jgi:hypothetical protein
MRRYESVAALPGSATRWKRNSRPTGPCGASAPFTTEAVWTRFGPPGIDSVT